MIEQILTSFSLAVLGLAIHQATKWIEFKPFNCELCMVFWVSFLLTMFEAASNIPVFDMVRYIGIAIFIRQLLFRAWPTMF